MREGPVREREGPVREDPVREVECCTGLLAGMIDGEEDVMRLFMERLLVIVTGKDMGLPTGLPPFARLPERDGPRVKGPLPPIMPLLPLIMPLLPLPLIMPLLPLPLIMPLLPFPPPLRLLPRVG